MFGSDQRFTLAVLFIVVVVLAIGMRLGLNYYSLAHLPPSSDEAIAAMLAEAIARGQSYPLLFTGQPYQFPVEAYLMSLTTEFVSRGSVGARYQALLLGYATTICFLWLAYRVFPAGRRWPAMLLVLLPSAYWLIQQSAYSAPQYASSGLFAVVLFLLGSRINTQAKSALALTFVTGAVSGLALSNHLLLLSVVAAVGSVVILTGNVRLSLIRFPAFSIGLVVGLTPLLLALYYIPGAYAGMAATGAAGSAFGRIFSIILGQALPGAFGVNPPYFGDFLLRIEWGGSLATVFAIGYSILLLLVIGLRFRSVLAATVCSRWPTLKSPDMFVITTLLCLVLVSLNAKTAGHDHRYLLPAVWSFPFLVGIVYGAAGSVLRVTAGASAVALAVFNVSVGAAVLNKWRGPDIWYYADIPHLTEVRAFLDSKDIRFCYASFWLAYRVTYETNDEILCAPVFNERFEGWPVSLKKQVDLQEGVAFILSNSVGSKFRSKHFVALMQDFGVEYQVTDFGQLNVYYDFAYPPGEKESVLAMATVQGLSAKGKPLHLLVDGDERIPADAGTMQRTNQEVILEFDTERSVRRVTLHYPVNSPPPPAAINVYGHKGGNWVALALDVPYRRDLMRFENGHPILGGVHQTIRFAEVGLTKLKIEIAAPSGAHPWSLSEVGVGVGS